MSLTKPFIQINNLQFSGFLRITELNNQNAGPHRNDHLR